MVEGRIVQRRAWEEDKQRWAENSKYFHMSNVRARKQEAWASSNSFQGRYSFELSTLSLRVGWGNLGHFNFEAVVTTNR